jgi:hypothetical protein
MPGLPRVSEAPPGSPCREPLRDFVAGKQVRHLVAEHRRTGGLEHDERHAGVDLGLEAREDAAQILLRLAQHARVVQRPSAADGNRRHVDLEPGGFEHVGRRERGVRMKMIVERVGPQHHLAPVRTRRSRATREPALERLAGEAGKTSRGCDAGEPFRERRRPRGLRQRIHETGGARGDARPAIDEPERIG